MRPGTVFVIDGSGNADQQAADRKRPIYQLDVPTGRITRPLFQVGQSALQFLTAQIESSAVPKPVLVAGDVPIGLPRTPEDVYTSVAAPSFLGWLDATALRMEQAEKHWRDFLIARGVATRSPLQPFVSIGRGEKKADVYFLRRCDLQSNGESVYCLDHGGKQVGRAALQFWFELLVPLRRSYGARIAVWPFEPWDDHDIIVGECYPAQCHRSLYGTVIRKRQSLEVAKALNGLLAAPTRRERIDTTTWVHAASSEDEFDMFTTALAFYELLTRGDDFFAYPADDEACRVKEGWMFGLPLAPPSKAAKTGKKRSPPVTTKLGGTLVPGRNRNDQESLGRSGSTGPKGPLHRMRCHRLHADGSVCGHEYETNAQDVFQKKCPVCQR